MAIYKIRPGFTIVGAQGRSPLLVGGDSVELSELEFEQNKHKLEGVEATVIPIVKTKPGNNNTQTGFPAPWVDSTGSTKIPVGFARDMTIDIRGSFFTPDMEVSLTGGTVEGFVFKSDNQISISVRAGAISGLFDLNLNNGKSTVVPQFLDLYELKETVVDLRHRGTEFSPEAIKMREGMSYARDSEGLYFTGMQRNWGSWVKLVGDGDSWTWNRSIKRKITQIFTNTSSLMIGIGSTESSPTSTNQWNQGEIMGYLSEPTSFSGFYGNSGTPGNVATFFDSRNNLSTGSIRKIVWENNGEPQSKFYLYELPNGDIDSWRTTGKLIYSGTIPSNMSADASTIMPFIVPRSSNDRILGFILE